MTRPMSAKNQPPRILSDPQWSRILWEQAGLPRRPSRVRRWWWRVRRWCR
jgi:hypothetical protein